jgi:hypothetical protein
MQKKSGSKKKLEKKEEKGPPTFGGVTIAADDDLIDLQAMAEDEDGRFNIDKVKINGKEVEISKINMKELKES